MEHKNKIKCPSCLDAIMLVSLADKMGVDITRIGIICFSDEKIWTSEKTKKEGYYKLSGKKNKQTKRW